MELWQLVTTILVAALFGFLAGVIAWLRMGRAFPSYHREPRDDADGEGIGDSDAAKLYARMADVEQQLRDPGRCGIRPGSLLDTIGKLRSEVFTDGTSDPKFNGLRMRVATIERTLPELSGKDFTETLSKRITALEDTIERLTDPEKAKQRAYYAGDQWTAEQIAAMKRADPWSGMRIHAEQSMKDAQAKLDELRATMIARGDAIQKQAAAINDRWHFVLSRLNFNGPWFGADPGKPYPDPTPEPVATACHGEPSAAVDPVNDPAVLGYIEGCACSECAVKKQRGFGPREGRDPYIDGGNEMLCECSHCAEYRSKSVRTPKSLFTWPEAYAILQSGKAYFARRKAWNNPPYALHALNANTPAFHVVHNTTGKVADLNAHDAAAIDWILE